MKNKNLRKKRKKEIKELEKSLGLNITKGRRQFLHNCSIKLNKNRPKSEVWFERQCKFANLSLKGFKKNSPFLGCIPDFINHDLKLIIEVDGNFHDLEEIKQKDKIKDDIFIKAGYTVIRFIAYNDNSLLSGFKKIKEILFQGS